MAGLIDPTVTGNYPVILGDGLLGKTSNDIFTGIRYNHKPAHSSSTAPEQARLKPAIPGQQGSYDLSYNDNGAYAFAGTRNVDSNQYVLHFDPKRKAFILDRIDSTFDMNITRTPTNSDPETLRRLHPHIEKETKSKPAPAAAAKAKPVKPKPKAKDTTNVFAKAPPKPKTQSALLKKAHKPEKKQVAKDIALDLPKPAAAPVQKPKARKADDEDEDEDEEEDGDDGLLIEYPGADPKKRADFSPAFTAVRRFDDFMDQRESGAEEADEADEESEEEMEEAFKLPSPVNNRAAQPQPQQQAEPDQMAIDAGADDEDDDMEADLEDDLEKDLQNAFEEMDNDSPKESPDGDESEVSEED